MNTPEFRVTVALAGAPISRSAMALGLLLLAAPFAFEYCPLKVNAPAPPEVGFVYTLKPRYSYPALMVWRPSVFEATATMLCDAYTVGPEFDAPRLAVPLTPVSVIAGNVADCSWLAKVFEKPAPPNPFAALKPVEYWNEAL